MTMRRTPAQRPQLYGLSSRRNDWPKPVLQPKGEYLGALIRSYADALSRLDPEHDPDGSRAMIVDEIARLRQLQSDLSAARAGLLAETA